MEVRAISGVENGKLVPLDVIDPEGRPAPSSFTIETEA
jgi:hypothetical protein